jgi:hypothetical protein
MQKLEKKMSRSQQSKNREDFYKVYGAAYELEPEMRWSPGQGRSYLLPLMRRRYGDYRVYVSRNEARFFTEETLPDFAKAQLAMMCARTLSHETPMTDEQVHAKGRYAYHLDSLTPDLGVRLSPSYFILRATEEQFILLGGDCNNKNIV